MFRRDPARNLSRRRFLGLGLAAGGGVLLLSACGSGAPPPSPTTKPAEGKPAESAVAESKPTTAAVQSPTGKKQLTVLRFWSMDYTPHNKTWGELAEEFTKSSTKYEVKLEPQQDWTTKYTAGIASGTAGDILSVHGQTAQRFILAKALQPLDAVISLGDAKERFFAGVIDPYIFKGKVYGIPLGNNTPGIGMILSVDAFEEAKIDVPARFKSWDEVWDIAAKLTKKDASGKITRAGLCVREGHQLQYVCGFMLEQGKEYFDEQKGEFYFSSPEGEAAFKAVIYDAVHQRKVDSLDMPEAYKALAQGYAAMGMIWIDYIPLARSQFPDKKFSFAVRPPFKGDKVIVVGEGGWGANVNAASKEKEGCYEFMKFLNRDETMMTWAKEQNVMPSVKKLIEDPWFKQPENEYMKEALKTLPDSCFEGPVGDLAKLNFTIAWPTMVDMLYNKLSIKDGMAKIDAEGKKQLQEFLAQAGKS